MSIVSKVNARAGLLGNPSDGYYGETISVSLDNFYAEVRLTPHPNHTIDIVPHPVHDACWGYQGLAGLHRALSTQGYYGGARLLQAMCKKFFEFCVDRQIPLAGEAAAAAPPPPPPAEKPKFKLFGGDKDKGAAGPSGRPFTYKPGQGGGFRICYDTNIPRQAGLSGSSAIATAALNCLLQHYGVTQAVPMEIRPSLVLAAEQDLGITAGLQDRVIQVYGGLMHMSFKQDFMAAHGFGQYTRLDPDMLPKGLVLIWRSDPSKESGKVHSEVKAKWLAGDAGVRSDMEAVAECAHEGRVALERHDRAALSQFMNKNFALRRALFGDEALGERNVRMVQVAMDAGCTAAKFAGSGGSVVALLPKGDQNAARVYQVLQAHCAAEKLFCAPVKMAPERQGTCATYEEPPPQPTPQQLAQMQQQALLQQQQQQAAQKGKK